MASAKRKADDIEHEGQRFRDRKSIEDRRRFELEEIDHQSDLIERALGRKLEEMIDEQGSVDYVGQKAIEYNANDRESLNERSINQDWLRRFFRYVADVDEKTILNVFAEALSEAAIRTRPLLSPRALDTLRFFEPHTHQMFVRCANLVGIFGAVPRSFLERHARTTEWELDLPLMIEMGLLKNESQSYLECAVGRVRVTLSFDPSVKDEIAVVRLTSVGRSIVGLLNKTHRLIGDPTNFKGHLVELFNLQIELGLNADVAVVMGQTLVSELSSSEMLETQISLDRNRVLVKQEKLNYGEGFGVPLDFYFEDLAQDNSDLASALLKEFQEFDARQASALKRSD